DLGPIADLELRLGQSALRLAEGQVETADETLSADGIILAVGADAIQLPGTTTLRTHDDARKLHEQLYAGASVAVIGAGWIGAEVAFAAAEAGCIVTVYEALNSPLAAALPSELGMLTVPWYEQVGIELRLGERVADVAALGADVVVAGLGARPATGWLRESAVELRDNDGAVVVDEFMRTKVEGVVAAGDCAAWWSKRYDKRMRVEHWDTALHAPAVAASSLLSDDGDPYDPVPYFWSDQFGHNLQFAGHKSDDDRIVVRGDTSDASWGVGWFNTEAELTAFLTVDHPRDLTQARRAMAGRSRFDLDLFADPATAVKQAVLT
ncbi:MAG TPA: FAD-dependent oxidoreductase, partial [Actinomycetes bacterium]|nr:FAD-dependent oxidoreductase [Actinomycetes bacterium]